MSPRIKIILNTARKPKAGQRAHKSQEKGSPKESMTFDGGMENNDKEFRELMTPKVEAEAAKGPTGFRYFPNLVRCLYILLDKKFQLWSKADTFLAH
jgi:hypothetical protein